MRLACLTIMAPLAEALQVVEVEKQLFVAFVIDDVIRNG